MTTWIRLTLLLAVATTAACDVNKYCLDCEQVDAAAADAAAADAGDGSVAIDGGGPDACIPQGVEVCDGVDDDCDGTVDEDVAEVGTQCGTDVGECVKGTWECTAGELVCGGTAVPPAPEECNDADDDCDSMTDEGDPGGGVVCGTDVGECMRGVTACTGGMITCEGEIPPAPAELCNAKDDDCDGTFDEGNPEGGASCGETMGTCMPGTEQCIGGDVVCVGGDGPSFELCDMADNDCDGDVDEDYDLLNDPNRCGSCTNTCTVAHGQPGCSNGGCVVSYCNTGYWDNDGLYSNGCEYACNFAGEEVCNGVDDDCDGATDEGLDANPPAICNQIGECAGTVATCGGILGWVCPYSSDVSTDMNGDIIPESDCDGLDNDCDGVPDDAFPTLGDACNKGMGSCQTAGTIVCNGTQDGTVCNAATPPPGTAEVCNGLDDDCDGVIDNGAPDAWVQINGSLWIYQYEASRPDATTVTQGVMDHRSCSKRDALPWTNVTQPEAEALCATVGARLCTEAEWQQTCRSTSGSCTWAFNSSCGSYQPNTCNGNDYDFDPVANGDQDGLLPTRSLNACRANWGTNDVWDLSGNVKEWTAERSPGVNPLRGGSYNNTAVGISCNFDFVVADDTFQFENVGFRCCRSTAP